MSCANERERQRECKRCPSTSVVCDEFCAWPLLRHWSVAAAGAAHAQQKTDVIFSAGPTGGSWTPMAAAASQVVNKRFPELNVQVEPGAALVNMEKIRNDKADIGWSMTTVMSDAQKGEGQFAGKQTDKGLLSPTSTPTSGSWWCPRTATSRASRI